MRNPSVVILGLTCLLALTGVGRAAEPVAPARPRQLQPPKATPLSAKVLAAIEVLKKKGLRQSGTLFVLPEDVGVAERLKELQRHETNLYYARNERARALRDSQRAAAEAERIESEIRVLREQYKETGSDPAAAERIRRQILERQIMLGVKSGSVRRTTDVPVDVAWNDIDYTKRLELTARLEAASQRYESLARDPEVVRAFEAINRESKATYRLGPTPKLKAELPELLKRRRDIEAMAIPLVIRGSTAEVKVVLNGSTPVPMVVDSGASVMILTEEVARMLSLAPREDDAVAKFTIADGSTVSARVTKLSSVRVGPFTVRDVTCGILPASAKGAECLLGASFLQNFVVRLSLAEAKLHLTPVPAALAKVEVNFDANAGADPAKAPREHEPPLIGAGGAPAERSGGGTLVIEATVDGTDTITLTPLGVRWNHESWEWPSDVRINGGRWDPKVQPNLPYVGSLGFLGEVDLTGGRVLETKGRGKVTVSNEQGQLRIRIADDANGASTYTIRVAFGATP